MDAASGIGMVLSLLHGAAALVETVFHQQLGVHLCHWTSVVEVEEVSHQEVGSHEWESNRELDRCHGNCCRELFEEFKNTSAEWSWSAEA